MKKSSRVILNTSAQYIRTIINIILTLYSTRLILDALGIEDYGLYVLVAGVISMLSFATNALSITTQRFLSFHQSKSKLNGQRIYFFNSLVIHFILGIIIVISLLAITSLLFNGFLNIPPDKTISAKSTYYVVSCILFITFLTSPFRAVLISHENIVYISIIDIIDGVLKVVIAICLLYVKSDKLVTYTFLIGLIQLFNLMSIGLFAFFKYPECRNIQLKTISLSVIREILSFAGWTVYSIGCVIGRTQGIAVIINKFYGSSVNAAYGIGFQISGYITVISESIINAIRPQIIKTEGAGNRNHMLWLSELASKYCSLLLCCIAIPTIALMPELLKIWLGNEVPEYAALFSRMVMIAAIFDTSTIGLVTANQAIGNIKYYSIIINTIKLITVPIVLITLKLGFHITSIAILFVLFEAICAFSRIYFLKKTGGLNVIRFIVQVFGKLLFPLILLIILVYIFRKIPNDLFRVLSVYLIPNLISLLVFYRVGTDETERSILNSILANIKRKLCR